ncbi:MAG: hypothetical protein ACE5KM_03940 [Planctomycetaceae bacterium]
MRYRHIAAVFLLTFAGCNTGDPTAGIETVLIEGTLTIDGKPYGPAKLTLTPEPPTKDALDAEGDVDKNGSFTLKTRGALDGAVEGKYKVLVDVDPLSGKGVPDLQDKIIEIKKPADGGVLKLTIAMKSRKR